MIGTSRFILMRNEKNSLKWGTCGDRVSRILDSRRNPKAMRSSGIRIIGLLLSLVSAAFASSYTFTTLDVPGATPGISLALGINNSGQVVGYYYDSSGYHGFLYSGGAFTPINDPAAPNSTVAIGINKTGQIVGYINYGPGSDGYLDSGGGFTLVDYPAGGYNTANGINDLGQIVGAYHDGSGAHGFLYSGGTFTTLDYPGANVTFPIGINNSGQIVGYYENGPGSHGFLYQSGTYTTIDVPGTSGNGIQGINNAGVMVGSYSDGTGTHGYVYNGAAFTTFDAPLANGFTIAWGINDGGEISGYYNDAGGQHGFLAVPAPLYNVCLLYDSTKAVHSGATIPIKLQLCDNAGNDVSSSAITVHAINITLVSSSISGPVQGSGNSNPDNDFRFDATLGPTGGYIFNLKTTGLTTGTYNLNFKAGSDTTVYAAPFQVK
jgi:probable HAF family extracellular repeat protein